jgi:hypothetical protein
MKAEDTTMAAPKTKRGFTFPPETEAEDEVSKSQEEMTQEMMTEKEVANPFRTLSAYITTLATI